MRRDARWPLVVLLALLLGCVSSGDVGNDPGGGGGGGNDDGGGGGEVFPGDPSFSPTRSSAGPGELTLTGQVADRQTLLLHLEMDWPGDWGKPYDFRVDVTMPAQAVEPVDLRAGTWPPGGDGTETWLEGTSDPDRFQLRVKIRGWKSRDCEGPVWSPSPMRLGTLTVRLHRSGQHPVSLVPPGGGGGDDDEDSARSILATCTGPRSPAGMYGGVILVP